MKAVKRIIGIALGMAVVTAIAAGPVRGALDVNQVEIEVADGVIENDLTGEENAEFPEEAGEMSAEEEYTESEIRLTEDGMLILPRPVMAGKVFVEWNTEEDGSGVSYKPGEIVDPMGITLYAVWADEAAEEAPEEATPEEASYEDAVNASGGPGVTQAEAGPGAEPGTEPTTDPATEPTEVGPGIEQTEAGPGVEPTEVGPGVEPATEQTEAGPGVEQGTEPTAEQAAEQTIEPGAEQTEEGQAIKPVSEQIPEQTAEPKNEPVAEQPAEPAPEPQVEPTEGGAQ